MLRRLQQDVFWQLLDALEAKVSGPKCNSLANLRRNVSLHSEAKGLDILSASGEHLRQAQRGPRLGAQQVDDRTSAPIGGPMSVPEFGGGAARRGTAQERSSPVSAGSD